jgi:hypothetical protein
MHWPSKFPGGSRELEIRELTTYDEEKMSVIFRKDKRGARRD